MKLRLKGAKTGHSLLKKKSDALTMRFREVLKQIIKVRCRPLPVVPRGARAGGGEGDSERGAGGAEERHM